MEHQPVREQFLSDIFLCLRSTKAFERGSFRNSMAVKCQNSMEGVKKDLDSKYVFFSFSAGPIRVNPLFVFSKLIIMISSEEGGGGGEWMAADVQSVIRSSSIIT